MNKKSKALEALEKLNTMYLAYVPRHIREDKELNEDLFECIKSTIKDSKKTINKLSNKIKHLKATNRRNEKKLKALEIIKEKKVEVNILEDCKACEEYNDFIKHRVWFQEEYTITQEEYDLLKEVLL